MNRSKLMSHMGRFGLAAALTVSACALQRPQLFAQTPASSAGTTRARNVRSPAPATSSP